jgi:hypothetical protein
MALNEFMAWFQQAPRPGFTKATESATESWTIMAIICPRKRFEAPHRRFRGDLSRLTDSQLSQPSSVARQLVSHPVYRVQIARMAGIVFRFGAQRRHVIVDRPRALPRAGSPCLLFGDCREPLTQNIGRYKRTSKEPCEAPCREFFRPCGPARRTRGSRLLTEVFPASTFLARWRSPDAPCRFRNRLGPPEMQLR